MNITALSVRRFEDRKLGCLPKSNTSVFRAGGRPRKHGLNCQRPETYSVTMVIDYRSSLPKSEKPIAKRADR